MSYVSRLNSNHEAEPISKTSRVDPYRAASGLAWTLALTVTLVSGVTEAETAADLRGLPPNIPLCSGYDKATDCYDNTLPPMPSLMRNMITPRPRFESVGDAATQYSMDFNQYPPSAAWIKAPQVLSSDTSAVSWGGEVFAWPVPASGTRGGANEPGAMQVLPWGRSSIDGRLVLGPGDNWDNLHLFVFSPENLKHDLLTNPTDVNKRPFSRRKRIPLAALVDPRTPPKCGASDIYPMKSCVYPSLLKPDQTWQPPSQVYWDLCTTASRETKGRTGPNLDTGGARTCTSSDGSATLDGDCYDVSLVAAVGYNWSNLAELTSTDLTVFVPRAKLAPSAASDGHSLEGWENGKYGVRIYPRTSGSTLPNYHLYESPGEVADFVNEARTYCAGNTVPPDRRWCEFFQKQRHVSPNNMTMAGWTTQNTKAPWPFPGALAVEPTTTADGRVLLLNGGQYGVVYAVNSSPDQADACHVDQWTELRPLSRASQDTRINTVYGFARTPLRDTKGYTIPPGHPVMGSYPWIDRKGDNLLFSSGFGRDAYKDEGGNVAFDTRNGKANVVVGAWTRGKMIVMDNALNFTDWGHYAKASDDHHYSYTRRFHLYQGGPTPVRPAGTVHMFSMESQLNYLDALSPTLPFDVVWTASSNTERNAEIVFDDYLNRNALVVAHMNAPMTTASYSYPDNVGKPGMPPEQKPPTYDDGFTAAKPHGSVEAEDPAARPQYRLTRSPQLQNASTIEAGASGLGIAPAALMLYGGARVEPVALGGVIGKGVYLDGVNDHIKATFANPKRTDWYFGVWLDGRDLGTLRTVLAFEPDDVTTTQELRQKKKLFYGSWIAVSSNQVSIRGGSPTAVGYTTQTVSLAPLQLGNGTYFHFGVKSWMDGATRYVQILINGNPVGTAQSFKGGTRKVLIHDPPDPDHYESKTYGPGMNMKSWFSLGLAAMPGSLDVEAPPTFRGWVDELRVFAMSPAERTAPHFEEQVCNQALGSLVSVLSSDFQASPGSIERRLADTAGKYGIKASVGGQLCEQIKLESHDYPNDLGLQQGKTLCAARAHKNTSSGRCLRSTKLGVASIPVVAHQYLPNFSNVAFCSSCHINPSDPLPGLRPSALQPGSAATGYAYQDRRRRPTDWPRVLTGYLPSSAGSGSPDSAGTWVRLLPLSQQPTVAPPGGGVYLDPLFYGNPRMEPQ